jgi:hypothetical protein
MKLCKLFNMHEIKFVLYGSIAGRSSRNLAMAVNSGKLKMRQKSTNGEKFAQKCAE